MEFCAKLFDCNTKSIFEICHDLVLEIIDAIFKDLVQFNKRLQLNVRYKRGEEGKKIQLAIDMRSSFCAFC